MKWTDWVVVVLIGGIVSIAAVSAGHAASSRGLMCQNAGKTAVMIAQDLQTEFKPEHYTHEWHRQVGRWVQRCKDDARGIEQCVRQTCEAEPS